MTAMVSNLASRRSHQPSHVRVSAAAAHDCTIVTSAARVASHRPSRWSALGEWSGSDDLEALALIKREVAFLACVQIAGAVRLVGPGQPLLDERGAEAAPLPFRIDAHDQKIPVRFRHEPLMELSHDVIGAHEFEERSKPDAERHCEHPATDHPPARNRTARRQPNRDRHPTARFSHMSVTKTVLQRHAKKQSKGARTLAWIGKHPRKHRIMHERTLE